MRNLDSSLSRGCAVHVSLPVSTFNRLLIQSQLQLFAPSAAPDKLQRWAHPGGAGYLSSPMSLQTQNPLLRTPPPRLFIPLWAEGSGSSPQLKAAGFLLQESPVIFGICVNKRVYTRLKMCVLCLCVQVFCLGENYWVALAASVGY